MHSRLALRLPSRSGLHGLGSGLRLFRLPALFYGCYLLFGWEAQRAVLFPGGWRRDPSPPPPAATGERLFRLAATEGSVEAAYLPGPRDRTPRPAAIVAHGNGETIHDWRGECDFLTRLGLRVLLVEYPGYGDSHGRPTQDSISDAMTRGWDWLASRPEVDARRIVVYGRSLGGGAACALATRRPLAAVVLQSTFSSVREMAGRYVLPPQLIRDPFDSAAVLRHYPGPVMVFHGRHDAVIPFRHAEKLAREARSAVLVPQEAEHNSPVSQDPAYSRRIGEFLRDGGVLPAAR